MATFTGQEPCIVIDALAEFQLSVMERLNRKFFALRRLAQLLEQIGDVTELVPNIGALIPVEQISLETYQRLADNCPFLGLPPVSDANLAALKARVIEAYANLVARLNNHPHVRMGKVQKFLDRFQGEINAAGAVAEDALLCLQTICDTAAEAGSAFNKVTQADISKQVSLYTQNFVSNGGQVMTEGMRFKQEEVVTAIGHIKELSTSSVVSAQ